MDLAESLPALSLIDCVALALLAAGTVRGMLRGLSGELARLLSVVTALVAALWLYAPAGAWLAGNTRLQGRLALAAAFSVTLIAAVVAMVVVRFLLKRVMKVVIEERFDRRLGLAAGFGNTLMVIAIVFLLVNMWPHDYLNRKFGEESLIGTLVLRALPGVRERIDVLRSEAE